MRPNSSTELPLLCLLLAGFTIPLPLSALQGSVVHTHTSLLLNMERKALLINSLKKTTDMKRASNPLSDLKHSWRNNWRSTAGTNKIALILFVTLFFFGPLQYLRLCK